MHGRRSSPALILLLTALTAGGVAGQERETREREAQDTVLPDTIVRDTVRPPPLTLGYEPATFSLVLDVGRPGAGEAAVYPVRAWRTDLSGTVLDSTTMMRTATVRGTGSAGLGAILGLGPDWALRLGVAVAAATLEADYQGEDEIYVAAANAMVGTTSELQVVSLETGLRYRIPSSKRMQPYLELGAAMSRWSVDRASAHLAFPSVTRFEAVAAVGGVIPLTRHFSARLRASTRVFQTPVPARLPGDTVATSSTLTVVAGAPAASPFADGAREILDLLLFQVGLSWDLGRPPLPPPPTPPEGAPADTTSPPGR